MPSSQQLKPRTALLQFGAALDLPNLTTALNVVVGCVALTAASQGRPAE
jgi:phosphatidylserine synthase